MTMKDMLFTVKQQKRELGYLAACFAAAFIVNVCAIISYGTRWKELYTQWFAMLALTVFFYISVLGARLILRLILPKRFKK